MADSNGNPNTTPHAAGNGQLQELTAAQVATKYGSGNIKTPTRNFPFCFNGHHGQAFKGIPIVCDTALLAYFAATGAPVV